MKKAPPDDETVRCSECSCGEPARLERIKSVWCRRKDQLFGANVDRVCGLFEQRKKGVKK